MRWIFIIVLVLNLLYLGWELDRQAGMVRQTTPPVMVNQDGLQRLVLVSESDIEPSVYPVGDPVIPDTDISAQAETLFAIPGNEIVSDLPDFNTVNFGAGSTGSYCYTFGPIEEQPLAVGVEDWFKSRRAGTNVRFTDESGSQLFWLYLAPDEVNSNAVEIIRDLQQKGIDDYRLVNKGNLRNAISLGLYSGQAAVNERLGDLEDKGYKPVIVPYLEGKRVFWVDVRLDVDPGALESVFKGYPARYNYVPIDCARLPS